MFWNNNEEEYTIIENVKIDELIEYALENNIHTNTSDISSRWALYTNYRACKEGLSDVHAASMGSVISGLMTSLITSCSTELYMDEESIDNVAFTIVSQVQHDLKDENETKQKIEVFSRILTFYKEQSIEYEKKIYQHTCNIKNKDEFTNVDGNTYTDKVATLLKHYKDADIKIDVSNHRINFRLGYTLERAFDKIKGDTDSEKLNNLIYDYIN